MGKVWAADVQETLSSFDGSHDHGLHGIVSAPSVISIVL